MAAERLQKENLLASLLSLFVRANCFNGSEPQYQNSLTIALPVATSDTGELIGQALRTVEQLYCSGYRYQKAGVVLLELTPAQQRQGNLFEDSNKRDHAERLMQVMDQANQVHGAEALRSAATGTHESWKMNLR